MLEHSGFPVYLYFKSGNAYSGEHKNMHYYIKPGTCPDPDDPEGKRKMENLTVTAWPGPWSIESTDDALKTSSYYAFVLTGDKEADLAAGEVIKQQAIDWLRAQYDENPEKWAEIPSILDCAPYKKPAEEPT